jgi:hypothetical protein
LSDPLFKLPSTKKERHKARRCFPCPIVRLKNIKNDLKKGELEQPSHAVLGEFDHSRFHFCIQKLLFADFHIFGCKTIGVIKHFSMRGQKHLPTKHQKDTIFPKKTL